MYIYIKFIKVCCSCGKNPNDMMSEVTSVNNKTESNESRKDLSTSCLVTMLKCLTVDFPIKPQSEVAVSQV